MRHTTTPRCAMAGCLTCKPDGGKLWESDNVQSVIRKAPEHAGHTQHHVWIDQVVRVEYYPPGERV